MRVGTESGAVGAREAVSPVEGDGDASEASEPLAGGNGAVTGYSPVQHPAVPGVYREGQGQCLPTSDQIRAAVSLFPDGADSQSLLSVLAAAGFGASESRRAVRQALDRGCVLLARGMRLSLAWGSTPCP
jgi:hypothetical protein